MTTIVIQKTKHGEYCSFICKGHAGYAGHGKDIVCASVSVLVINTINALEQLAGEMMELNTDEESGYIKCSFKASPNEKSVLLVDAMILGLKNISSEYGERFCKLKFEEV